MNNGTINCERQSCKRLMYNNEAVPVIAGSACYKLCPDCASELYEFFNERNKQRNIVRQSMTLKEINRVIKEKASRYAEERFMAMGWPQMVALPEVVA